MLNEIVQVLRDECQVTPGTSLIVGVSGGADSVALLHLLKTIAADWSLTVRAAHLDHALRRCSREDALWVAEFCRELGVPLLTERVDVAELARQRRQGIEEAARFARYRFLLQLADAHQGSLIALAHQRGDQAETFLFRLLRGSGVTGLRGMAFRRGRLIRPLLGMRREQLEGYLAKIGQLWLSDPSNRDTHFTRNRIRHQLLPELESYNPQIEASLCSLAGRFAVEEDFWDGLVIEECQALVSHQNGQHSVPVSRLRQLHPALRLRIYRRVLHEVRGDLQGLTAVHISAVENLVLSARSQAAVDLPGAWVARRYDRLLVTESAIAVPEKWVLKIDQPGVYPLPGGRLLTVSCDHQAAGETSQQVEFAASKVDFPFVVRNVVPGDRFRPSGMSGRKKIKDYFIDVKLTHEERAAALVLEGPEILWVVGLRRCEGFMVELPGETIIRMSLEPVQNGQTAC